MFCILPWNLTKETFGNWFKWIKGRQSTGYSKLLLFFNPFIIPFDIHLLEFKVGAFIPPHKDKIEKIRHFRLNFVIKPAKIGGEFKIKDAYYQSKYLNFFRSDICEHEVTKVENGTRYVLSVGWALR